MSAIGAVGLDVAVVMADRPFYLSCLKVVKVNIKGKLKLLCSAKDGVLKMLEIFATKGNVVCIFEYDREGVNTIHARNSYYSYRWCWMWCYYFRISKQLGNKRVFRVQGQKSDRSEIKVDA